MSKAKFVGAALAMVGLVVVAATAGSARSTHSALSGAPIVLFGQGPVNSATSNAGTDPKYAGQAAVDDINAHGGINGRPLKWDFCDDHADPNTRVQCAQQAVSDGAVAVFATALLTSSPIYQQNHIPEIGATSNPGELQEPTQFGITGGATAAQLALAFILKARGFKNMGIIASTASVNQNQLAALGQAGARAAKLPFAGIVSTPNAVLADYSPYAQQVKAMNASVIDCICSTPILVGYIRAMDAIGLDPIFATSGAAVTTADVQALGSLANNLIITAGAPPVTDLSNPGIQAFTAAENTENVPQDFRREQGVAAWVNVHLFATILRSIKGDITASTALHALQTWPKSKKLSYGGLVSGWCPACKGPAIFPRLSQGKVFVLQAKDGQITLAQPQPFDVFAAMKFKSR
jgi:ABC-type branched-subunit amino acid transport system substrate-binding protein